MTNKKSPYPFWVRKHRKPGTQVRRINGKYYLYKITSLWDKKKKRAVMQTKGILGRITSRKFIPSFRRKLEEQYKNISVREFGFSHWLHSHLTIIKPLKTCFPLQWEFILSALYCRIAFQAPLKRFAFHLQHSALRFWIDTYQNSKTFSQKLAQIGQMRHEQLRFMKHFFRGTRFALVDVTPVFSASTQLGINHLGYNSEGIDAPQVNLLFIYSLEQQIPIYYKVTPGNVRDVIAMKDALKESGLKKVVVVGDKGFYSVTNVRLMDEQRFSYLLPLKRNDTMIDYGPTQEPNKKGWDDCFVYQKRAIWYAVKKSTANKAILLFLDEGLRKEEETDYVIRMKQGKQNYNMRNFRNRYKYFGTLALYTNLTEKKYTPEDIYHYWKTRNYIEQMYATLKTALEVNRMYLREENQVHGFVFIHFISLQIWYHLLRTLKEVKLHPRYSPEDIIKLMLEIKQCKIGKEWQLAAVPKHYKDIMKKLAVPIV